MIGSSKNNRENFPRKCFRTQEQETRVKRLPAFEQLGPGLSSMVVFSLRNSEFVHRTGLRREVSEQDSTQLDYVMPMVQNGLNKTTKALSECISVKDVVSSWYDFLIVLVYGKWVVTSGISSL